MTTIKRQEKYNFLNKENRVIYDRKRLEAISISEVIEEHPEWIQTRQESVGKSEERIQDLIQRRTVADLCDRMIENNGPHSDIGCNLRMAKWIMENIPEELVVNINEWIENRPLSDIKIHNISVLDIMSQFGERRPITFLEAIDCMIYWKKTDYRCKHFCKLFFLDK